MLTCKLNSEALKRLKMTILLTAKRAIIVALILPIAAFVTNAQNPSLELTAASRGSGNGPVLNSGAFTFLNNYDNPTGTNYSAYTTALTVTFGIENPQYTGTTNTFNTTPTRSPIVFGVTNTTGSGSGTSILSTSFIGVPSSEFLTASGASTGTGIDLTTNKGVRIYYTTTPLYGTPFPPSGYSPAYYYADLVVTFNRPTNNPRLHFTGLGAKTDMLALHQILT